MLSLGKNKKKQMYKWKKCNAIYLCDSKYDIGNLIQHLKTCVRINTREIGQLFISQEKESTLKCLLLKCNAILMVINCCNYYA